ncbi:MarR family winged helix-turn-helix transcriptional regulator [Paraburkholderia sp. 32]|uniref:MarR family winged helix-turn-helix transcriptional regulator n=1 Tax=Paraburkholderia sp. 32 TaxID=2991057 RepID=UPI003D222C47
MKNLDVERARLLSVARRSSLDHLMAQRGMRELASMLNGALRPLDISAAQFCLLSLLYRNEAPTSKELAREMQAETAVVSAQLSILARRALVTGVSGDGKKRGRRLKLTPFGTSVLFDAIPLWLNASNEAALAISTSQLRRLRSLARVSASFRSMDSHESEAFDPPRHNTEAAAFY